MSTLALREARRHVRSFSDECELVQDHREGSECRECEAFLQLGIDAFRWLVRADETIRGAIYTGGAEHDARADESLRSLFRAWLRPCDFANQWIAAQQGRGYHLGNLDEFRASEREVRSIVKAWDANVADADVLTDAMRDLRDSAVTEHRNGETAEFV